MNPSITLTTDNYHSLEADDHYMSVSQYKGWLKCAARQKAILSGNWSEPEPEAFSAGKYVDMALLTPERLAAEVQANHDLYFTKQGKPRAFVTDCDAMIARCRADRTFMSAITGQSQTIITFTMFGVMWKAMLDVADPERSILTDLKTARSLTDLTWSDSLKERLPFYEVYGYWTQLAVYRQAFKHAFGSLPKLTFIAAVSKESPPVANVFLFDNKRRFRTELAKIKLALPRIMAWKTGTSTPPRCERCGYCRETFRVSEPVRAESFDAFSVTIEEFAIS